MRPGISTAFRLAALIAILVAAFPAGAQVKDHTQIKYPDLPEFKVPRPEVYTLDNGLTVFLMEDHELPLITVRARIRTGSNYEPANKTGLGEIFGQVQREGGTASMGGDEIDDFLEARAASVETGMGGEAGSASMNCLAEDFDEIFDVFIDVLRTPAFAEDKLELARVQTNTSIARRNDSVGSIIGREFSRLIYGADSPLARMTEYATVANVSREDLLAWHAEYYHPNNTYIGVVGDFDSARMKKRIEAKLGGWPRGKAFTTDEVAYNEKVDPGVYFIEKSDVTQANIRLGHLGIRRKNPDYYAVVMMNEILGGGFSGRLLQNVRSKKGLAYSVFGRVGSSFLQPGIFLAGMSTKSETMAESIEALKAEIVGIIDNPPSTDEMQQAREGILNSFVFNYTSRAQILGQQMTFAYYDMPEDYLETYRANIEKVTAEDVARVAKKYVHPDETVLLVVGKAEDFDRPVSSFGKVTEIDITIPPPPDTRAEVVKSTENLQAGARLLEKVAGALNNGVDNKLTAYRAKHDLVVEIQGTSMTLEQKTVFALPDKVHRTVSTPMGEQVVVINGTQGLVWVGEQSQPLPPQQVQDGIRNLGRDLIVLASSTDHPDLEAVAAGSEQVDGATCDLVAVSFKGAESRLCVDPDGMVIKQTYQDRHPFRGNPGLFEVLYSEYVEIDGRLIPHMQIVHFDGEKLAQVTLAWAEINPELDPSQFDVSGD